MVRLPSGPVADAYLAGDLGGGDAVVAGDYMNAQPGLMGTGDGFGYFGAGRVEHGHQAEQAQSPLDVVPGGRDLSWYQLAPGDGQDPQAAPAVVREGMVEVLAVGVGQGSTGSPGGGQSVGSGQHGLRGAFGVRP